MNHLKVAAVQLRAEVGAVERNLARCESLVREAFQGGARWVILPEFFPSAMAYTPAMLDAWRAADGEPLQWLRRLAREYDGVIGGSFLAVRDGKTGIDCYNTWQLVFPDGSAWRHDKDLPTMWENCYYIGGDDDGVLTTPAGNVGVAMCWEMIRTRTARRLLGKVALVVGGSCWWDLRLPVPPQLEAEQRHNLSLLRTAPSHLAKMLGVPVVHASHAGEFHGLTPGNETVSYASRYLGETQIVDGHGHILARMAREEGEGVIAAEIRPGRVFFAPEPIPEGFWTADMSPYALKAWESLNAQGRDYYARVTKQSLAGK